MVRKGRIVEGILGAEYLKQVTMTIDFKSNTVTFHDNGDSLKKDLDEK